MELIIAFVLGILIASVIFSLVYSVTGVLKIKKQLTLHKDYDDALSHNIDAVKDHLTKLLDDVKRTITDDIDSTNLRINKVRDSTFRRIEDTEIKFDKTLNDVINSIQNNINTELLNSRNDLVMRIEDTELMFDKTIGKVIDNLQDNINGVDAKTEYLKKYVDSRIDKAVVPKKKLPNEIYTEEETNSEITQINS